MISHTIWMCFRFCMKIVSWFIPEIKYSISQYSYDKENGIKVIIFTSLMWLKTLISLWKTYISAYNLMKTFCIDSFFHAEFIQNYTNQTSLRDFKCFEPIQEILTKLMEQALYTCRYEQPAFWKRYFDNMLTALPQDQVQDYLNFITMSI